MDIWLVPYRQAFEFGVVMQPEGFQQTSDQTLSRAPGKVFKHVTKN
jgi:hypothetical protein